MLIPTFSVGAPPSGLVDHEFHQSLKDEIVAEIERHKPDIIAFEFHGAMGTTELPDGEGDMLRAMREAAGPGVPIGIGLDLHAHLTEAMLESTDICIAYKENPHSDTVECGEKVAELLLECHDGKLHPVTAFARLPMILPGAAETAEGPLWEVHEAARDFSKREPGIRDISIYNVFRFADDVNIGQVVTVMTNGPSDDAPGIATELAGMFWSRRDRFQDQLLTIDEALNHVLENRTEAPFAIGDMGDRVLAGAPGDSVAILSAALARFPTVRGGISITDPVAAKEAVDAGVGATVTLAVGGRITPGFKPQTVTAKVEKVTDGKFTLAGPFHAGEPSELGLTAILLVDDRLSLVVTSLPAYGHDPAVYTSQGVKLEDQDFVIAKSGYHFMLNYKDKATPLLVASPGVGYYQKGLFDYKMSKFWPEHDVSPLPLKPRVFASTMK